MLRQSWRVSCQWRDEERAAEAGKEFEDEALRIPDEYNRNLWSLLAWAMFRMYDEEPRLAWLGMGMLAAAALGSMWQLVKWLLP